MSDLAVMAQVPWLDLFANIVTSTKSRVYYFPLAAPVPKPHQPRALRGAPKPTGSYKWQQMPPFTPLPH